MTQQPKKWIRAEIESLDPEVDYVRIWQLGACYGADDFMQSLLYALTFPNFIVTEWGSEVIWREDGGKVLERSASRVEQTQYVNALWWWYGPHDERTKKSVDGINRLHGHWAGKYPGRFSYNEDYIYVCAFSAILMHRLLIQMGFPGVSPKEQIAGYKFWGEMSKLFVAEGGVPLHGYPDDFEGCIRYCEAYENTPRPKPERANLVGAAIHEQFVFRFFPKEMHWLGHQLIRSLALPTTLEALQIDPPLPMAKEVLPKMLGLVFWYQTFMQDDPPRSFVEDRENLDADQRKAIRQELGRLDKSFPAHFTAAYKDDARFAGCPFHAALPHYESDVEFKVPSDITDIEKIAGGKVGILGDS
jgi:hypothetical protein